MVTQQDIDDWERDWRARLVGCSLVFEAEIPQDDAITAVSVLGRSIAVARLNRERDLLAQRYRAILLAGMTAIGTLEYDAGTYWPNVWEHFEVPQEQNLQSRIATAYKDGLTAFGLTRFALPLANVGEILMHGGIPIRSVTDFARTLAKWDSRSRSGDGASFVAWMRSMSKQLATTKGVDVPTWRFVTEGGDAAEDFVNRCLGAIDSLASSTQAAPPDLGLPQPVLDEIARAIELGATPSKKGASRQVTRNLVPAIHYAPAHGLRVSLPPLEAVSESDIDWTVSSGGMSRSLPVRAPWPGDPIMPSWMPVSAPSQRVVVTVMPAEQSWELALVDVEDPLLVFDGDSGLLIPARNALPRGRAWLAFPDERRLEVDGDSVVVERPELPHGWHGWTFEGVELDGVARLRLDGAERWRYVSATPRPRLIGGERLPFVETRSGEPVFGVRPELELPGTGQEDGAITWRVEVTDVGSGRIVAANGFDVHGSPILIDPWEGAAADLLGEYAITVRGPLGRGAQLRAAIAESTSVDVSSEFRWMRNNGEGLEPAELVVTRRGLPEPVRVRLDAATADSTAHVADGDQELILRSRIPHMHVSATGPVDVQRAIAPMALELEGLTETTLGVKVPQSASRVRLAAVVDGAPVQALESSAGARNGRSFNLAQFADTLAQYGSAQLRLVVDDASTPVALVRPRKLASGVVFDGESLILSGAQPIEGLTAVVYPYFAPWREPTVLPFPADATAVPLPAELRSEGQVTVSLVVANPWIPFDPPLLPDWSTGNTRVIDVDGLREPGDERELGFRLWLAGSGPCPKTPATLPLALRLYTLLPQIRTREIAERLRSDIAGAVRANRELLMGSVLHAETEADELARLFVESDVVTVPCESWESSDLLWSYSPALGVVADSDEHEGDRREEFRDNLVKYVGNSALRILDHGEDPHAGVGRFGDTTIAMHRWPGERVDEMWHAAGVLPTALLDLDTRARASKHLFDVREHPAVRPVSATSAQLLAAAREAIARDTGFRADGTSPIDARINQDGWANLPALSLAFAFVARLAARNGHASTRTFEALRKAYTRLAMVAPDIVQQDLGLAELWLTRWSEERE